MRGEAPTYISPLTASSAVSPNGKYVLVACRDSDVIQVFSRDQKTGLLKDTGKDIKVPHPVCVILTPTSAR